MNKFIVNVLMLFFFLTSIAVASEQEVRDLCVEKTVSRCLEQCEKTNNINCTEACQDVAKNQCRQAGE